MAYFLSKIVILVIVVGGIYASVKAIQQLRNQKDEDDKHYHH